MPVSPIRWAAPLLALLVAVPTVATHVRPAPLTAGLVAAPDGWCEGGYVLQDVATTACTHGPDRAPADRTAAVGVADVLDLVGEAPPLRCVDDGTSGRRVQLVYARTSSTPDRLSQLRAGFSAVAATVQQDFVDSALAHGGSPMVPRFVHTPPENGACTAAVSSEVLSQAAAGSFPATIEELRDLGYDRSDRRYLVMWDGDESCGIGQYWDDDRPAPADNLNDRLVEPLFSRIDTPCWAWAETHELVHNLGGVQASAPNATGIGHCNDDHDQLCYGDGGPTSALYVDPACAVASVHERLLDCNGDDYFHPSPPAGTYLATHWNVARSSWLVGLDALDDLTGASENLAGELEADPAADVGTRFVDDDGSPFEAEIEQLAAMGVTEGCNPPTNDRFCPTREVTRGQLAGFLDRALDLPGGLLGFLDTDGGLFDDAVRALVAADVTEGCDPPLNTLFCPTDVVTRGQMAAFLARALDLPAGSASFADTRGGLFEDAVASLAEAGITLGCNPPANDRFCPTEPVTRAQMAAFLVRGLAQVQG